MSDVLLASPDAPTGQRRQAWVFWGCLVGLNVLLFLPRYLINLDQSTFLPPLGDAFIPTLKLLVRRDNADVFRISLEVLALVGLRLGLGRDYKAYRVGFGVLFGLMLGYEVYAAIIRKLYATAPVFFGDVPLAREGLRIALEEFTWGSLLLYAGPVLGLGLAVALGAWLIRHLSRTATWAAWPRLAQVGFVLVALAALLLAGRRPSDLRTPSYVVRSTLAAAAANVQASHQMYRVTRAYRPEAAEQAYAYKALRLASPPNVVLIFIESYGTVVYEDDAIRPGYLALADTLTRRLAAQGWHAATHRSAAPVTGGASWLAYTSVLFGLTVDNHGMYRFLTELYQDRTYPDFGQYLRAQGYTSIRLSALPERPGSNIPWTPYANLYNLDGWIRHVDLEFRGTAYGWGPSPPDQYTMSFALDHLRRTGAAPFLLFFITQNSHYPWTFAPEVADDWRSLNTPTGRNFADTDALNTASAEGYLRLIDYELQALTQVITETPEPTLFILIGDHQPPLLTPADAPFTTPLHVITRDTALVQSLGAYGFAEGLRADEAQPALVHAGLYSLFVRELARHYRADTTQALPPYLPEGLEVTHGGE